MKDITIDCRGFVPRSDLHRAFADALAFPDHYGNNLDALHDILTSLPSPTELTFLNWAAAEEALGRYAKALQRMLTDAGNENPLLTIHYK